MKNKSRFALAVAMFALVAVLAIGGTIAWLTAGTDPVTNTFTTSDIEIDLEETTVDYKMVPGTVITKDPKLTVEADSEACWLFVKVEKSANFDTFMTYAMDDRWNELSGVTGVYYQQVDATTADTDFTVLENNAVTVRDTVTKDMMNALTADTYPTLTFTGYACQQEGFSTAAEAWAAMAV